jgi:DNA-binding GntR family transcriptional regulator
MPSETLHERMRHAILALELAPGQRLSERGLEPEFGASRTPIRAALMRLESDGLVRRDARGWVVTPIDLDEIRSLYEFREVVEVASIRLAIERASDADIDALVELARSADELETPEHSVDTGTSFHLELARLAGNPFLFGAMNDALTRLYRTRWLEVASASSRERAHHEHTALAAAVRARDLATAELAMTEHLRGTGRRLVDSLEGSRRSLRARGIGVNGAPSEST